MKCSSLSRLSGTTHAGRSERLLSWWAWVITSWKRLMNHRTMRSADVTQGYLHFGADELLEPASRIERAILEHAGLVESKNLSMRNYFPH